jgi:hypothetical protein
MSDEQLEREVLSRVSVDRRAFVKKYVIGAAFAVPVVASFFMRSSSGHALTFTSNACFPSNSTPNIPTSKRQCKNGGWRTLTRPDCTPFTSQKDCESFFKKPK